MKCLTLQTETNTTHFLLVLKFLSYHFLEREDILLYDTVYIHNVIKCMSLIAPLYWISEVALTFLWSVIDTCNLSTVCCCWWWCCHRCLLCQIFISSFAQVSRKDPWVMEWQNNVFDDLWGLFVLLKVFLFLHDLRFAQWYWWISKSSVILNHVDL